MSLNDAIAATRDGRPVLIAGPTASGKSALALAIAEAHGGIVVNADALQVHDRWRILTARPEAAELARAPHALYGHVPVHRTYSVGHWLREVTEVLAGAARPIVVGGTGLYLTALTEGLSDIPQTPSEIRRLADGYSLDRLLDGLDGETRARLDTRNRARVQRAWEVLHHTGTPLAEWHARAATPVLAASTCHSFVMDAPPEVLNPRIARRFDTMLDAGALDEVRAALPDMDPARPADRAIGVAELAAHLVGRTSLPEARDAAIVATRQYAKRQRTWFRKRMKGWSSLSL